MEKESNQIGKNQIGKFVIVRSDKAGVFFGILSNKNNTECELTETRKLFYWESACAVEQIALEGVKNDENCKFTVTVSQITINDYCQILTCSEESIECIKKVKEWKS